MSSYVFVIGTIRGFLIALALYCAVNLGPWGLVPAAMLLTLMTPAPRN